MNARGRIYARRRVRQPHGTAKQRIADLLAKGYSTKRIAQMTDLCYNTVRNTTIRLGYKPIRHSQWLKTQMDSFHP